MCHKVRRRTAGQATEARTTIAPSTPIARPDGCARSRAARPRVGSANLARCFVPTIPHRYAAVIALHIGTTAYVDKPARCSESWASVEAARRAASRAAIVGQPMPIVPASSHLDHALPLVLERAGYCPSPACPIPTRCAGSSVPHRARPFPRARTRVRRFDRNATMFERAIRGCVPEPASGLGNVFRVDHPRACQESRIERTESPAIDNWRPQT